jgi:hypothetical protein
VRCLIAAGMAPAHRSGPPARCTARWPIGGNSCGRDCAQPQRQQHDVVDRLARTGEEPHVRSNDQSRRTPSTARSDLSSRRTRPSGLRQPQPGAVRKYPPFVRRTTNSMSSIRSPRKSSRPTESISSSNA